MTRKRVIMWISRSLVRSASAVAIIFAFLLASCGGDGSGDNCTVTDNGDGTYDLTCGVTTVTLHDGEDGAGCTVIDNGDGSYDVTCGTVTTTMYDGQEGTSGIDGDDCTVTDNGDGTYGVICGTTTATLHDGQPGTPAVSNDTCLSANCHGNPALIKMPPLATALMV